MRKVLLTRKHVEFEEYSQVINKWLDIHVYPARDGGASIFFDDITEKKELEKQRESFISIASHELKTPLTSVKAMSQLLVRKVAANSDFVLQKYVQTLDKNVDKLVQLNNDLLDVKKLETRRITLRKEEIKLDELVRQVVENIQLGATSHKIIVKGRTRKRVRADKEKLHQVFTNLITNAIKYSPDAQKVVISLKTEAKTAVVKICDYGIGIEKKFQKRIFDQFFQAGSKQRSGKEGLGLGLYIAREIVKKHKGTISVVSDKGKGSTFTVKLPYI